MPTESDSQAFLYDVFISYSRKDRNFAARLEKSLEAYKPPKGLNLPQRNLAVFRDEQDFTGVEYHTSLEKHLKSSRKMIVLCSPGARPSKFVNDEIHRFAAERGSENIIPVLISGIPNNEAKPEQEDEKAFPQALCELMEMPLATNYVGFDAKRNNLNRGVFYGAWYTILADLYDVSRNEIEERDKKRKARKRNVAVAMVSAVFLIVAGLAIYAWKAKMVADSERDAKEIARAGEAAQKDRALIGQSRFVAALSRQQSNAGNAVNGMLLALEGLPDKQSDVTRPYMPEAENALYESQSNQRELFCLTGHQDVVWQAAFSRDGSLVATASWDKTARVWDATTGELVSILMGHEAAVRYITFSPDGSRVATASNDGTARLWDVRSGKQLAAMSHAALVSKVVYSPDGDLILTTSYDATAKLWNAKTGMLRATLRGHRGDVTDAAFSPSGLHVATISDDLSARVWDAKMGQQTSICLGHTALIHSLSFSPEGNRILTGAEDNTTRLWDVRTGKQLLILSDKNIDAVMHGVDAVAFSPDGSLVASATYDLNNEPTLRMTHVYDARTGKPTHTFQGKFLAFSPDGAQILTSSEGRILDSLDLDLSLEREEQDVVIWDTHTGERVTTLKGHEGSVTHGAFNSEGTRLVTASRDRSARIWTTRADLGYIPLAGLKGFIRDIVYSPNGVHIMARTGTTLSVWEAQAGKPVVMIDVHDPDQELASDAAYDRDTIQLEYAPEDVITSAAFDQGGTNILTTSSDGSTYLWDLRTGLKVATFKEDDLGIWKGAFLKGDKRIVTISGDMTVRVWDLGDQRRVAIFKDSEERDVEWADLSSDGTRLVMVKKNSLTRVWDIETQRVVVTLDDSKEQKVTSVALSNDGLHVAIGYQDGSIKIWSVETGKSIGVIEGQNDAVVNLDFSSDGTKIIGSIDKTVGIWDIATGSRTVLTGHTNGVLGVSFSATGTRAISAAMDGSARVWDVRTGHELSTLRHTTEAKRNYVNVAVFNPGETQAATAATNIVRLWRTFPSPQSLVDYAKSAVPRCLTQEQRKTFFLDSEPPRWCLDLGKWPYRRSAHAAR